MPNCSFFFKLFPFVLILFDVHNAGIQGGVQHEGYYYISVLDISIATAKTLWRKSAGTFSSENWTSVVANYEVQLLTVRYLAMLFIPSILKFNFNLRWEEK